MPSDESNAESPHPELSGKRRQRVIEFTEALKEVQPAKARTVFMQADSRVTGDVLQALDTIVDAGFDFDRPSQVFSGASVNGPSSRYSAALRYLLTYGYLDKDRAGDARRLYSLDDSAYSDFPWLNGGAGN